MSGSSLALHEEMFSNLARCVHGVIARPVLANTQPRIDRGEWARALKGPTFSESIHTPPLVQPVQMIVVP